MRSKAPDGKSSNQLLCRTVTGSSNRAALLVARSTASRTASQAETRQPGCSLARARAMAPVPVPRSSTLAFSGKSSASAASTRHSVSGRGISVDGLTFSGSDQNSCSPSRCATGWPSQRRSTRVLNRATRVTSTSRSGQARKVVRDHPVT